MSKSHGKIKLALSALALLLPFIFLNIRSSAATARFIISPTSGNITQGSSVAVTIQADYGTASAFAVQACVVTDNTKLQLINIDYSGDPLGNTTGSAPSTDCSAGEIQLGRYDTTPASGTFTVATLTFKALQANTTAAISFDDAKSNIGGDTPSGSNAANFSLAAVPAPAPSPAPSSPAPTTTKSSQASAQPATASPAITDTTPHATPISQATSTNVKRAISSNVAIKPAAKKRSFVLPLVALGAALLAGVGAATWFILRKRSQLGSVPGSYDSNLPASTNTSPSGPSPTIVIKPQDSNVNTPKNNQVP